MRKRHWAGLAFALGVLLHPCVAQPEVADTAAVVRGNSEFAVALYRELRVTGGNVFLSPFSISTTLAMTYAGAKGTTALEMQKTLRFPLGPDRLGAAFLPLIEQSQRAAGDPLRVANALWCQVGSNPLDSYVGAVEKDYQGSVATVDFEGATELARQTINTWITKETQGKIKDLFARGMLKPSSHLVLTNAIHFKANWASRFDPKVTQDQTFYGGSGETRVPMMYQKGSFGYHDGGTFQVLELPYEGNELSMIVFLPTKLDGLAAFETSLTVDLLEGTIEKLKEHLVSVSLPRFTMTDEFQLGSQLQALGMLVPFDCAAADFSGITGKKDLCIDLVVHKAFVEVNEEGTEAAAATGVVMQRASEGPPTFKADHPFLFVICDNRNGGILFMGRVVQPEVK